MKEITITFTNDSARSTEWLLRKYFGRDKRSSLKNLCQIAVGEAVQLAAKRVLAEIDTEFDKLTDPQELPPEDYTTIPYAKTPKEILGCIRNLPNNSVFRYSKGTPFTTIESFAARAGREVHHCPIDTPEYKKYGAFVVKIIDLQESL